MPQFTLLLNAWPGPGLAFPFACLVADVNYPGPILDTSYKAELLQPTSLSMVTSLKKNKVYYFYLMCVAYVYVNGLHVYLAPTDARGG